MTEEELLLISKRGPEMAEVTARIANLSKEDNDRLVDEGIEKDRRDRVAEREYARDEGKEEGRKEGREEGMEKGMALVASNMLKNKTDIGFIAQMTGLSEEEILKLKKKSEEKN